MKNKMIFVVTCVLLVFGLTACSSKPTYYSKKEVKRYVKDVFSEKCELKEEKSYPDDSVEGNPIYEYIFETKNGMSFSVYSYTRHPYIAASETRFYEKHIGDNYISSVMALNKDEIEKICQAASFDYDLTTYDDNDFSINLYLDNYEQIDEAAQIICNIDDLISFKYDYRKYSEYNPSESVYVYLRPDNYEEIEDWKTDGWSWKYEIDDVDLSHAKTMRLDKTEVADFLEGQLAAKIRRGATYYSIPEEILNKHSDDYTN